MCKGFPPPTQSGDELVVARQRVVCAHAQWCLGEVEEGAMDAVSTLSAGLMISWLKAYGVNTQLYSVSVYNNNYSRNLFYCLLIDL